MFFANNEGTLKIHRIHGGKGIKTFVSVSKSFFLGVAQIGELWLYFLVDAVFILEIGVMILLKLKKKNLDENLRVGGTE